MKAISELNDLISLTVDVICQELIATAHATGEDHNCHRPHRLAPRDRQETGDTLAVEILYEDSF